MGLDVLLLEDDPSKKNRLLALLNSKKDIFNRVDAVLCTADAIRKMKEHGYDLLIADIVVPAELGGDKAEENCIAMFEQIDDGYGDLNRPSFALPVSASSELTKAAHEFFQGRPWGILAYSEANNECLATVEKVARFVLADKNYMPAPPTCDIFLLTALFEPEFAALEALPLNWGPLEPLDNLHLVRFGSFAAAGQIYKVAAGFCARMGPVAATILTTKAMLKLRPTLVIMAGICAGIPGKADIGDVVAADISWDWQSGKYIDKMGAEAFEIAPHQLVLDDRSRNQLLLLKRDTAFWNSLAPEALKAKAGIPKLVIGPMATGASVLADSRVADRIKTSQHKNVAGLDMETYGVFAAATGCDPSVKVLSMKAVCDKGDLKKGNEYQEYASRVSAAAVLQFMEQYASVLL